MKSKKGDRTFGFLFAAAILIAIPTGLLQNYLKLATGKLTILNSVGQIDKKHITKYYEIQHYYIAREYQSTYYTSSTSGKYNQTLNLELYFVCPVLDADQAPTRIGAISSNQQQVPDSGSHLLILLDGKRISRLQLGYVPPDSIAAVTVLKNKESLSVYGAEADQGAIILTSKSRNYRAPFSAHSSSVPPIQAWYCIRYTKSISNRLHIAEKKEREHEFYRVSLLDYQKKNLQAFSYLMHPGNDKDRDNYKIAISKSSLMKAPPNLILEPEFGSFGERTGNKLSFAVACLVIGNLVWLTMILFAKFREPETQQSAQVRQIPLHQAGNALQLFVPKEGRYATVIIADLNILIFLIMVFAGEGFISFPTADLLHWGANYRPYTENGEWYRLLTSIFLHGGIIHLLTNLYALVLAGIFLEPVLGRNRFAGYYLLTGVIASIASLCWQEAKVSVGASGAIFGLYGILLGLLLQKVYGKKINKAFFSSIFFFVAYNLLIGTMAGNIDNAAHVGGLLSGFVIGLLIAPSLKREQEDARFNAQLEGENSNSV
jgi:membrane associated rhomboid family serine protease